VSAAVDLHTDGQSPCDVSSARPQRVITREAGCSGWLRGMQKQLLAAPVVTERIDDGWISDNECSRMGVCSLNHSVRQMGSIC
jgi:hypothetical protein